MKKLYFIISHNPRHHGHIVLVEEEISEPLFGEWSMGFRNLYDKHIQEIPRFRRFMDRSLIVESFKKDPMECWGLLKMFREESR